MAARPPPPPPPSLARVPAYGTRVSRTYEPDDPTLDTKVVRPFSLENLEHIPGEQRAIFEALWASMPETLFRPGLTKEIAVLIKSYLGLDLDIWFDGYRMHGTRRLRAVIPGTTCLIVLGVPPRDEKMLLEIDLQFAYRIVGELLGTHGATMDLHRPLTEIEQGVFLFVALKVLALIQSRWSHAEQLMLRIEDVRSEIRSTADVLRQESNWLCASWKLFYDLDVGVARLLIPEGLARGVVLRTPPRDSQLAVRTRNRIRQRLSALGTIQAEAWIEAGSIELGREDLEQLEPGDIILLEGTTLQMDEQGGPTGPAMLKVGLGRRGGFQGELRTQEGVQVFEVQDIVVEEIPGVHDPVEGHGEHENPESLVAGYEQRAEEGDGAYSEYEADESDDGGPGAEDLYDEDFGLDDEDHSDGDYEDYEGEEDEAGYEGEEGYEAEEGEEGDAAEEGYEAEESDIEEDNLIAAEPLLGDIPMICVVELGRVQLTADEVIRLRSGQLIELGRAPTDPVDLVVNGKLVAKGELVEIEGALGVKLLSLVGEE